MTIEQVSYLCDWCSIKFTGSPWLLGPHDEKHFCSSNCRELWRVNPTAPRPSVGGDMKELVAGSTPAGVSTVAGSQMPDGERGVDPAVQVQPEERPLSARTSDAENHACDRCGTRNATTRPEGRFWFCYDRTGCNIRKAERVWGCPHFAELWRDCCHICNPPPRTKEAKHDMACIQMGHCVDTCPRPNDAQPAWQCDHSTSEVTPDGRSCRACTREHRTDSARNDEIERLRKERDEAHGAWNRKEAERRAHRDAMQAWADAYAVVRASRLSLLDCDEELWAACTQKFLMRVPLIPRTEPGMVPEAKPIEDLRPIAAMYAAKIADLDGRAADPDAIEFVLDAMNDARNLERDRLRKAWWSEHPPSETALAIKPGASVVNCAYIFTVTSVAGDWTWVRTASGESYKIRTESLVAVPPPQTGGTGDGA